MKKLFISQPMNGKTNEEILKERNKAIEHAKTILKDEIEVIDSFFQNAPNDAKPLWFLGKSLELLANADAVYFCGGWNSYRGCIMEHSACVRYHINIIRD